MKYNDVNSTHQHTIERLIREFGTECETVVRNTYREQKLRLERNASILLYVPILASNAAREMLKQLCRY